MATLSQVFTSIADAIRAKTGGTALMTPAEMVTEIANIPAGGGGIDEDLFKALITGGTAAETPIVYDLKTLFENDSTVSFKTGAFFNIIRPISFIFPDDKNFAISGSFCNNSAGLTALNLPNTVTEIGPSAFRSTGLTGEIDTPASVTNWGTSAFSYNNGLTSAKIRSVINGLQVFGNCPNLTKVWISRNGGFDSSAITQAGYSAFINDTSLEIYCELSADPGTWGPYWNIIRTNPTTVTATVHWGVSEADFDELV